MVNYIKRLISALRSSSCWNDALDAYKENNHDETLLLLEKYNKIRHFKSREKILQGMTFRKIGRIDDAIEALRWAFNNIDQDNRQNIDENKYLAVFTMELMQRICTDNNLEIEDVNEKLEDYDYNKSNVRKSFLWAFPIRYQEKLE